MTQKQITHLQNMIDDFMSIAVYEGLANEHIQR